MSITIDTTELERRIGQRLDAALDSVRRMIDRPETEGAPPRRWISAATVAERIGRSKRTLDEMVGKGEFPRWAVVLHGARMWRESDVEAWMMEREEAGSV